jgi:hypothetical protein
MIHTKWEVSAKERCYVFKDLLLGKAKISRIDEDYDMESDEGKKLIIACDMNESAYTKVILSIDDNKSISKVEFNQLKCFKNKDYADGNASMSWGRLRNKFKPFSAPSLIISEKSRQCLFKK